MRIVVGNRRLIAQRPVSQHGVIKRRPGGGIGVFKVSRLNQVKRSGAPGPRKASGGFDLLQLHIIESHWPDVVCKQLYHNPAGASRGINCFYALPAVLYRAVCLVIDTLAGRIIVGSVLILEGDIRPSGIGAGDALRIYICGKNIGLSALQIDSLIGCFHVIRGREHHHLRSVSRAHTHRCICAGDRPAAADVVIIPVGICCQIALLKARIQYDIVSLDPHGGSADQMVVLWVGVGVARIGALGYAQYFRLFRVHGKHIHGAAPTVKVMPGHIFTGSGCIVNVKVSISRIGSAGSVAVNALTGNVCVRACQGVLCVIADAKRIIVLIAVGHSISGLVIYRFY